MRSSPPSGAPDQPDDRYRWPAAVTPWAGSSSGQAHLVVHTRALNRLLAFDVESGAITGEGGIQWPQLIDSMDREQDGHDRQWGIY